MNKLEVTLTKGFAGCTKRQKDTALSLGLHRIGQRVEVEDSPAYRGMLKVVSHLVRVEEKQ
ncbi:MAG: 50S ribosomal protein L30 [Aeriscardovia sp.]|nr:50S ribosomal protein L30 [Aeriscardovia sp.]